MSLEEAIIKREEALKAMLEEKQVSIDDRTGKGMATERIIEDKLIRPSLTPRFDCMKGAVVCSEDPDQQSQAIDRVIYDKSVFPLSSAQEHSIFPIESVCGLVEITMSLNANKLKTDIERMAMIKAMRVRWYLIPFSDSPIKVYPKKEDNLSPRSYVIGPPTDPNWDPKTIAKSLKDIQCQLGPPTHVHGLYVIGVGFFETIPVENEVEQKYDICYWSGPDRLFRFSNSFRQSLDRWPSYPDDRTVDLGRYIKGEPEILSDR